MGSSGQPGSAGRVLLRIRVAFRLHKRKAVALLSAGGLALVLAIVAFLHIDILTIVGVAQWAFKKAWPALTLLCLLLMALLLLQIQKSKKLERERTAKAPKIARGRWESIKSLSFGHIEYSPFLSYNRDAEPIGFGPDLLNHLFANSDIELRKAKRPLQWGSLISDLARDSKERIDLLATPLFVTYERSCDVSFTAPLFYCEIGLYVNKAFEERWFKGRKEPFSQAIETISADHDDWPKRFFYVSGEISEKLARKYGGKSELDAVAQVVKENPVSAGLAMLAQCSGHEGAFMFSEVFHASNLRCVQSGEVINVLEEKSLLYPVAFALRKGDYILQNLLNILILQIGGPEKILDILANSFVASGGDRTLNVRNYYATCWKTPSLPTEPIPHTSPTEEGNVTPLRRT